MGNGTLRLVSREFGGFEESFKRQAQHFQELHPEWELEREFVEIHSLFEDMVQRKGVEEDDYDLFLCVTDWLPELFEKGGLTPLNEYLEKDPPPDWPDGWSPSMRNLQTTEDGTIYGMAYHDGPEMFIYREDLFKDPDEKDRFEAEYGYELEVPETWSQFLDVAHHFNRPDQDLHGTVVAAYPDAHNNVYDFLIQLWSRGGALFDDQHRPVFDSDAGREALQFYVDLINEHRVVPENATELDSVASGEFYAEGKAAMMWNWCGFVALAEMPDSPIKGRTACDVIPRGEGPGGEHTSLNVYWVLTIPRGSNNKDMAYEFIKETASPGMDKETTRSGGTGTRLSTWRDPEIQQEVPFYRVIEQVHETVRHLPRIPEYPSVNEVLNEMVDDAVNQRQSVTDALSGAHERVQEILREAGYTD